MEAPLYECPQHHVTVGMCCGQGSITGFIEYGEEANPQYTD